MPKEKGEYDIILGTFNDNKFTWHHVNNYNDLEKAYKAFKDYVNSQLKYTDEELLKVWNTGRLDIELRKGSKLLNWVGVYSREVDRLAQAKESEKNGKNKKDKKVKDSASWMGDKVAWVKREGDTEWYRWGPTDAKTEAEFIEELANRPYPLRYAAVKFAGLSENPNEKRELPTGDAIN